VAPLGGVGAGGPRASTINAVKTLAAGPLGGGAGAGGPGVSTINAVKTSMVGLLGGGASVGGPRSTSRVINLHGYHRQK
jgi:hypothetical protein